MYSWNLVVVCCKHAQPNQGLPLSNQFVGLIQSSAPEDRELYFEKGYQYNFESQLASNHATKAAADVSSPSGKLPTRPLRPTSRSEVVPTSDSDDSA